MTPTRRSFGRGRRSGRRLVIWMHPTPRPRRSAATSPSVGRFPSNPLRSTTSGPAAPTASPCAASRSSSSFSRWPGACPPGPLWRPGSSTVMSSSSPWLQAPAGLPSVDEGAAGFARFDRRSGGASLWERVPPVFRARNSALAGPREHQGARAGLLRAYRRLKARLDARRSSNERRAS